MSVSLFFCPFFVCIFVSLSLRLIGLLSFKVYLIFALMSVCLPVFCRIFFPICFYVSTYVWLSFCLPHLLLIYVSPFVWLLLFHLLLIWSFFGLSVHIYQSLGRNCGKGSEHRKSLRRKSKKEHRKSKIWKGSERWKFEKDQNVKSLICLIFKFWWSVNYLWRKYLWRFGVNLKSKILKNLKNLSNLS